MDNLAKQYQAMIEAFNGFIYICSADYLIEYMNPRFIERCGRDGTGQLCYQILHNLTQPCSWCVNDRVMRGETVRWEINSPLDHRWYDIINVPIHHADGTVSKQAMITDITDRKLAEEKTEESERHYRELSNALPLGIYEADRAGKILFVNQTACTMFGYTDTDIQNGLNLLDVLTPQDRPRGVENMRTVLTGSRVSPNEYLALRKDQSKFPVLITSLPLLDKAGQLIGFRGTAMDITERKQIESILQNSQRLESLSVLAGGIAHDFNNLLTGIFSNLEMARIIVPKDSEARDFLNSALTSFTRAKDLTQQLLTFAKGGTPDIRPVFITTFLKDTVLFSLSGSNVKAEFSLPDDIWSCNADAHQIGQVVDNLVINARQAMPHGGVVKVGAKNIPETEAVPQPLSTGRYISITIQDSGAGIPSDILPRIFDPFFTTKSHGSGLGLSMAYSIIKNHHGLIVVESQPHEGSTFTIYLPASTFAG